MNTKDVQKMVYANKVAHGFNVTDVNQEFCLMYGEVAEAYDAWLKKKDDLGGELADVAIFLLGISEILGFDLGEEVEKKMRINAERKYKEVRGVKIKA